MPKKSKVEKPFNSGTMSRSAFFGMIRSALRQKSRWWKPITECKNKAKRKYVGPNKRRKWEYQCNTCKQWFDNTTVNVDHIKPAGQLNDFVDLPEFVKTLFCEVENLQVLCKECHDKKSKQENNDRKKPKPKVPQPARKPRKSNRVQKP